MAHTGTTTSAAAPTTGSAPQPTAAPAGSGTAAIFRIEIALLEVDPAVHRTIEIPGEVTLAYLHEVIQEAMGWENSHLHKFTINQNCYGIPDPDWDPIWDLGARTLDEADTTLARVLTPGQEADYVYDFGDNWHHTLIVTALTTADPGVRYPRCIDGHGACPPEDVGGTPGYAEFLDALADPDHPEHTDRIAWWGSDQYDPHHVDLPAINEALKQLR
ncbi:plasmid pRiA4b ORF-3 family protein [Pseudonocardia sp. ICBG1142]|uniref:plasmid pRiA4b ORF-3 family protein n=1 Tax=Pseudonocardia sp. ICBG1142 TaxID=2846760 RepID=UPI001CF68545|nr:plasmid pRiA4b ORF-3 family protein [Pseudonocardia sp. ICBG1142]